MAVPAYIKKNNRNSSAFNINSDADQEYRPLLGSWLLELAIAMEWHRLPRQARRRDLPDIFEDDDFLKMTGISPSVLESVTATTRSRKKHIDPEFNLFETDEDTEDGGEDGSVLKNSRYKKILVKQLEKLRSEPISAELPLFKNITMLSEIIGLTEADQTLLVFVSALELFKAFRAPICNNSVRISHTGIVQLLSRLTCLPENDFRASLSENGVLLTSGLLKIGRGSRDLEDKFDLMDGFSNLLLTQHENCDELLKRFLKRAKKSTLSLEHFPHLTKDTEVLQKYIGGIMEEKVSGVNILIHGKPGVGKTEYVQALAESMGVELYEIAFADEDGDPIKGEGRLRAYTLCQSLLARTSNTLLLFDEIEDVFPSNGSAFLRMLFGGGRGGGESIGKAWINRTMEQNVVPAVWVCNQIHQIDPAYLRRFDYSIQFPIPPAAVRLFIANHHLNCFEPPQGWLEKISANEQTTPAQLEKGAKVAKFASNGDNRRAIELVERTLAKSVTLLGQKKTSSRNIVHTEYSLEFLNTDMDLGAIVNGLQKRAKGTFCFYGAAGTGKSELARYIADQIGLPIIVKRASDIIDKYVGETEKNIAKMFGRATDENALLLLDEADSFLSDRKGAERSWEVTQVNELLTQMEAFDGIFICTTNLMERLDPASLRRFAFKIQFKPLNAEQRIKMFRNELKRLGGEGNEADNYESEVKQLNLLTPGDFAVAARQFELWGVAATAEKLFEGLQKECVVKGAAPKRIGFGE